MTTEIIEARRLTKSFGSFKAVDDLSFTINNGEVYGFLGQNGAGKSTTMRMLLGLIYPDNGTVYIRGREFNNRTRHLLAYIGAVIERPDLYLYLTGWENLKLFAHLSGKEITSARMHEVLDIVGLSGREKDKVKGYSQGMKQRLGIAIALIHDPELLILDEPTNGLDPQGIAEMRFLINRLSRELGKTIMISSHLLHEIEQVATNMIILHKGRKIVEGKVADLLSPADTSVKIRLTPDEAVIAKLKDSEWKGQISSTQVGQITFKTDPENVPAINSWLVNHGAAVLQINVTHSLEDYFLSLTSEDHAVAGTI